MTNKIINTIKKLTNKRLGNGTSQLKDTRKKHESSLTVTRFELSVGVLLTGMAWFGIKIQKRKLHRVNENDNSEKISNLNR
ncbi:MAG: hypothetical protein ACRC2W_07555 [Plesiomonas shigelloides]